MSINKKLFDNISLFHKLAFYGNRSTFLKSMAQQPWPEKIYLPEQVIEGTPPENKTITLPEQRIEGTPPRQVINLPEQVIEGTPPQKINLPEQVIEGTPLLKGKPLYDLFARMYKAVKSNQTIPEQDRQLWSDNSASFKQRADQLDRLIAAEKAKGTAANAEQMNKWQVESNAIKSVFAKQL